MLVSVKNREILRGAGRVRHIRIDDSVVHQSLIRRDGAQQLPHRLGTSRRIEHHEQACLIHSGSGILAKIEVDIHRLVINEIRIAPERPRLICLIVSRSCRRGRAAEVVNCAVVSQRLPLPEVDKAA